MSKLTSGRVYVVASGFEPSCFYVRTSGSATGWVYVIASGFIHNYAYEGTSGLLLILFMYEYLVSLLVMLCLRKNICFHL